MSGAYVDPRRLCQIEILVSDLKRSVAFYDEALGWKPAPAQLHDFVVLSVPDDCPFGIGLRSGIPEKTNGNQVVLYFAADHPQAVIQRVGSCGGHPVFGPNHLPGYGYIWQFADPDGNRFGLYSKTNAAPNA